MSKVAISEFRRHTTKLYRVMEFTATAFVLNGSFSQKKDTLTDPREKELQYVGKVCGPGYTLDIQL